MKIRCYGCGQKLDVSELTPLSTIECPVCMTNLIVPMLFGELLLEERIGEGSIARVYRAMDRTLDREIAVKVLRTRFREKSSINQAFISQARVASAINHPHVIPIYSCGEQQGLSYIVMQYMGGGSIADRIQNGPKPSVQVALRWLIETIKGLESAQVRGVLHGDVQPANILLDVEENVKVADFGLAQIAYPDEPLDYKSDDFQLPLTRSWYISPEKISSGVQDVMGDIYGLGASFYHLVTGQPPFSSPDARENVRQRFQMVPPPPRSLNTEIPEGLSELLMAMLAVYPSDRPESYASIVRHASTYLEAPPKKVVKTAEKVETPSAGAGKSKIKPKTKPKPKLPTPPTTDPQGEAPPAEPDASGPMDELVLPPRAGALVWACRLVLTVLAAAMILLGLGHVTHAGWYTTYVRPHLPATDSPSASSSPGGSEAR